MVATRSAVGRAQAAAVKQASTIVDVETFRFLDLPPQIRNCVYTFHLHPTIAAVSILVRQESLALFFAETPFEVYVGADLWQRLKTRPVTATELVDLKYAGALNIKRSVLRRIRYSLKEAVILRDVTFKACECMTLQYIKNWNMTGAEKMKLWPSDVRMRFDVASSGLEVTAAPVRLRLRIIGASGGSYGGELTDIVEEVREDVRKAAEEVAGRKGFIGFTVKDSQQIAKAFRMSERDAQQSRPRASKVWVNRGLCHDSIVRAMFLQVAERPDGSTLVISTSILLGNAAMQMHHVAFLIIIHHPGT
ncbi:hypothetical protein LTR85_005587 [Meristemomyces frigidus]|nr:hypothetical protein LTR85_005587 [Meristemomyces frigidus]